MINVQIKGANLGNVTDYHINYDMYKNSKGSMGQLIVCLERRFFERWN